MGSRNITKAELTKQGNIRIQKAREKNGFVSYTMEVCWKHSLTRKRREGGNLGAGVGAGEGEFDWDT